jgi:hypothetical protein
MIMADQFVVRSIHPSIVARYLLDAVLIAVVLIVGVRAGKARRERVSDRV